jgi:hypothetical protein
MALSYLRHMEGQNFTARAAGAAVLFAAVASGALAVLPSLALLVLFIAGPAGVAFLFAGGGRAAFNTNGMTVSAASGVTGAAWVGALSDAHPVAVLIGSFVSLALLSAMGAAGCYVLGRVLKFDDTPAVEE